MERPGASPAQRVALLALVTTAGLAAAKLWVWVATDSLAVLSQTLDSVLDIVALGLVFYAVRIAGKPADESHHYGHGKAENLVAFTQTLLLGAVVIGVAIEAIAQLTGDGRQPATPWYAFALLGTSALVDAWRARALTRAGRAAESDALKAGALNLVADVGTAIVAFFALFAVRAGAEDADAIGALVVAAAVAYGAVRLGKRSVDVLMDRAPVAPVKAIEEAAAGAPGVEETRRVRVRSAGSQLFADVTVAAGRTASLERAHDISEGVERAIGAVAPGADVVVHVEPISETPDLIERAQAAASRTPGIHEVHNVAVHRFDDSGGTKLHVTLHAKVPSGTSLEEAHELSDRIEDAVAQELGERVRVDSHIEPMTADTPGRDVTGERADLVAKLKRLAEAEEEVLDCHEVLITSDDEKISIVAHVTGKRDLPLARIHDASERIEKSIHAEHPEVGPVLIHFEPR